jgi:hypothetical protein
LKIAVVWNVAPCGSVSSDDSEERVASIFRLERISEIADLSYPEDGGEMFLRNVGCNKTLTLRRQWRIF